MANKTGPQPQQNRWITPGQLEVDYEITESAQAKMRMKRKIPFSKIGSKFIRYDRIEIDKWLEKHKVGLDSASAVSDKQPENDKARLEVQNAPSNTAERHGPILSDKQLEKHKAGLNDGPEN